MLAGAIGDGKPVHPGLRKPCPESVVRIGRECEIPCPDDCEGQCEGIGFIPNPNPMDMIAAVLAVETREKRLWNIHLWADDDVTIGVVNSYFQWRGPNLTDAMFQATKTLADNWADCPGNLTIGERRWPTTHIDGSDPPCAYCHGTGKVMDKMQNLIREVDDDDGTRTGN